ncbi:Hsp70 family protein [Catellatospora sp. NPDC049111]|uniref:Hsp70 family protein n=2 Tax=unclassified Catellatospora TaxID=2645785 RepID=UPI0033EFCF1B
MAKAVGIDLGTTNSVIAVFEGGQAKAVAFDVVPGPDGQSIPLLLLLDHGQVRARQVGAAPPCALLRWVEQVLAQPPADQPRYATRLHYRQRR